MNTNERIAQPIWSLQTMLRLIAQYDNRILSVIPDGIYSNTTAASVLSFQKQHSLPPTGETDFDTWYTIVDSYKIALEEIGPAASVNPIFQKGQIIYAQETNQHLYMIHGIMQAISDTYPSMPRVKCNNVHDDTSIAAIQWLQVRMGVEPTGNITRLTWKYLSRLYRITIGDGTRT